MLKNQFSGSSSKLSLCLKIAISIGLCWLVFSQINWLSVYQRVENANKILLISCLLLLAIQPLFLAERWRIVLKLFEVSIVYSKLLIFTYESLFFNQTLPSSVGGDISKVWRMNQLGTGLKKSMSSIVFDRLIGLGSLVVVAILGFPIVGDLLPKTNLTAPSHTFITIVGLSLVTAIFLGVGSIYYLVITGSFTRSLKPIQFLIDPLKKLVITWRSSLIPILTLSLITHAISITAMLGVIMSLEPNINVLEVSALIPFVLIATAVPISIAGWGVREGSMIVLMGFTGMATEVSLAASLISGILSLSLGLCGGILWLYIKNVKEK